MNSPPRGVVGSLISRQVNSRKRPHVALEYEASAGRETRVGVKQESPSTPTPCHYGEGGDDHRSTFSVPSECTYRDTSFHVKVEPADAQGSQAASTSYQTPPPSTHPSYPYALALDYSQFKSLNPDSRLFSNSLKCETQHRGNPTHHIHSNNIFSTTTFIGNDNTSTPNITHATGPDCQQFLFGFSPWGLAAESEAGITFGNLVGLDMSKSLKGGEGLSEGTFHDEKVTMLGTLGKGKSPRGRSKVKREEEEDDGWEPPLWRQQLQNIIKMRELRDAPVDLMGAHKNAEQTTDVAPEVGQVWVTCQSIVRCYRCH